MTTELTNDRYTYRVTWSTEDGEYIGLCAEFPSLSWLTDSQEEALRGIRNLVAEAVEDLKSSSEPIPAPFATRQYSGKFTVRMTPDMHRKLHVEAAEARVSFNRFVCAKLAESSR